MNYVKTGQKKKQKRNFFLHETKINFSLTTPQELRKEGINVSFISRSKSDNLPLYKSNLKLQ